MLRRGDSDGCDNGSNARLLTPSQTSWLEPWAICNVKTKQKKKRKKKREGVSTYSRRAGVLITVGEKLVEHHSKAPHVWGHGELALGQRLRRVPAVKRWTGTRHNRLRLCPPGQELHLVCEIVAVENGDLTRIWDFRRAPSPCNTLCPEAGLWSGRNLRSSPAARSPPEYCASPGPCGCTACSTGTPFPEGTGNELNGGGRKKN